ncbi:hypothetical protein F2Q68_00016759 [Brassica cretica]|uniref:Uncharacterized protein n=1 Tax=Brassica cretica TaxID=69181 RepID=A0A8S9HV40_BRACR|nr:hypothetical protein F2Q68_00016759 [Brassica cretica]
MEDSPYRKFSFSQGKGGCLGTGPRELHSGESGFLLAETQRPVFCLGSGGIQYLRSGTPRKARDLSPPEFYATQLLDLADHRFASGVQLLSG